MFSGFLLHLSRNLGAFDVQAHLIVVDVGNFIEEID